MPYFDACIGNRFTYTMIRKNTLFIKLFHLLNSSKQIFQSFQKEFTPKRETCPCCGSKGNCRIHAYYNRHLIDYRKDRTVKSELCVTRVICESCRHTHAILPDVIIPYRSYSLHFTLQVLYLYLSGQYTAEKICEKFGLSSNHLRKLIQLFHAHKKIWLGVLADQSNTDECFLVQLTRHTEYSTFSMGFIQCFSFSFLQAHQNPTQKTAPYCQKVFVPDYPIT